MCMYVSVLVGDYQVLKWTNSQASCSFRISILRSAGRMRKGSFFFFFLLGCVVNCFTGQFFDLKIDVLVHKVVGCGYFKFKYFNFFFLSFLEVLTLPTSTGVAKNALLNFRIDQLLN